MAQLCQLHDLIGCNCSAFLLTNRQYNSEHWLHVAYFPLTHCIIFACNPLSSFVAEQTESKHSLQTCLETRSISHTQGHHRKSITQQQ